MSSDLSDSSVWIRAFTTGATRDTDKDKPNYAAYICPLVIQRFGAYMLRHEIQSDGQRREPGNWKKGMSRDAYMESLMRHVQDVHLEHEGHKSREGIEDALCGIIFNSMGYLHEVLLGREVR